MSIKKRLNLLATVIISILLILTLTIIVTTKINGGKTTFFGNQLMVVLSGSMAPTFDTGSVVTIKPVRFENIKKGDIITFTDLEGRTVTHRVLVKQSQRLITKGDANKTPDLNAVAPGQVIGKVNLWVPYIGFFINFLKTKNGLIVFCIIPGLYLIISQIWEICWLLASAKAKKNDSNAAV